METRWARGAPLDIRYTNSSGETSTRRIHVRHTYAHGDTTYVVAWCELRREERVFRADRIVVLRAAARTVKPVRYQRTPRQDQFVRQTGIDDRILFRVYQDADGNGNDVLEWHEITQFQSWVYRSFRYEFNATALPPNEFGARGGGDCEDFALYTCGLMSYWGYDCWVGSYEGNAANGWMAHAVALLAVEDDPVGMDSFVIPAGKTVPWRAQGQRVIPIDYDQVGGFTNATPAPQVLSYVFEPRQIYGSYM